MLPHLIIFILSPNEFFSYKGPGGRYEAMIKIPYGKGLWPAFWMLPSTPARYGRWPKSGGEFVDEIQKVFLNTH